jgi:hypothetical protein
MVGILEASERVRTNTTTTSNADFGWPWLSQSTYVGIGVPQFLEVLDKRHTVVCMYIRICHDVVDRVILLCSMLGS